MIVCRSNQKISLNVICIKKIRNLNLFDISIHICLLSVYINRKQKLDILNFEHIIILFINNSDNLQ